MTFIHVISSDLNQVEYNTGENKLTIIFNSGGIYSYHGVPVAVFDGLINSFSKGKYFHTYIKNRYPTRKLR